MERVHTLENAMLNNIKMSTELCRVRELDAGMELLEKFLPRIHNCHEFYICLYQNWDSVPSHIREITSAQEEHRDQNLLMMPFAYKSGTMLHACSFTKKHTLPDYIYTDSRSAYIYSPLYFEDREFGYVALSYKDNILAYQFNFLTWLVNVSRMLQNICESKQTDLMVSRLEDIYMRDELTGLYNRQGFNQLADTYLEQAKKDDDPLLAMVFDLDGLRIINDTFGHLEGDFAIQVLGHALEHNCTENMLLARIDGDEFFAFATGLTEENAKAMTVHINKYLDNYNRLHTKKYNISASIGYALKNAQNIRDLQELFADADQKMYLEKNSKNKAILKG